MSRTAVYRAYDSLGELLYVGVAHNWGSRWEQHAASPSALFTLVARLDVEWYNSRSEALTVEADVVRQHRPLFNVNGCDPRRRLRPRELRCDRCGCLYSDSCDEVSLMVGNCLGAPCGDQSVPPFVACEGRLRYAFEVV